VCGPEFPRKHPRRLLRSSTVSKRVRKIGRFVTVAIPIVLFLGPVLLLAVFPWLIEAGFLEGTAHEYLTQRVFHGDVTYESIRIERSRRVVLEGLQIAALRDLADASTIRRTVLHFDGVIPFGRIERIEFEGMKLRLDLDRKRLEAWLGGNKSKRPRPAPDEPVQVLDPTPRTEPKSWLAGASIDLSMAHRAKLPTIEIHDAEIEGSFGGRPYHLVSVQGLVRNVDGHLLPFDLHGTFADSGEPALVRGHADFQPGAGELKLSIRIPEFRLDAALDSKPEGASLDIDAGPVRFTEGLRAMLSGIDISGTARTTVRLRTQGGRWQSASIQGILEGYRIAAEGIVLEGEGPTALDLQLVPVSEGASVHAMLDNVAVVRGAQRLQARRLEANLLLRDEDRRIVGGAGSVAVVGLELRLDGEAPIRLDEARLAFDVLRPDDDHVEIRQAELVLAPLLTARGSGTAKRVEGRWRVRARASAEGLDIAALAVRAREWRGLDELELHGEGRADLSVDVDGDRNEARLALDGVTLHYKDALVRKLDGVLTASSDGAGSMLFKADAVRFGPVRLAGAGGRIPLRDGDGWLRGDASLKQIPLGRVEVKLRAAPGRVELPEGLRLEALGGTIELGPVLISTDPRRLETSLTVKGVTLDKILEAAGSERRAPGSVEARYERIMVEPDRAEFAGWLAVNVALGRVMVHELSMADSKLTIGATAEKISLDHLGRAIQDTGIVHGVVDATLRARVDVSTRRPETLELTLRSVGTGHESQMVSLRSVRRVMAASGDFKGARKLAVSPINRLYYAELGLYARIEDGKWFTLRGKFYRPPGEWAVVREYSWEDLRAGRVEPDAEEMIMVGARSHRLNIYMAEPGGRIPLDVLWDRVRKDDE